MADIFPLENHKFEALKLAFDNQAKYLERFTQIDFRLFSGYITLQLVFAGWLSQNPICGMNTKAGLFLIDLTMAVIAAVLINKNHRRRNEEISRLANICLALEFSKPGAYLVSGESLYPTHVRSRPSLPLYLAAIAIVFIGVSIVLFLGAG